MNDHQMTITANAEMGAALETIPVSYSADEFKIAFNARYLFDVIRNVFTEEMCMRFNSRNLSGDCVAEAMRWYKVGPQDTLILADDIDLPLGTLRVRPFGGAGTHNGWRDILLKTGSDRFPRVRIGTGAKPPEWDLADWVLSRYTPEERKVMESAFELWYSPRSSC